MRIRITGTNISYRPSQKSNYPLAVFVDEVEVSQLNHTELVQLTKILVERVVSTHPANHLDEKIDDTVPDGVPKPRSYSEWAFWQGWLKPLMGKR